MKTMRILMILMAAGLLSVSLSAQEFTYKIISGDGYRYEGEWPKGHGILYSYEKGLILGEFHKGRPHGKCVCYKPGGEVYWGDFKKGKATGAGRIYRDNGIVMAGGYKNGRYHGIDTIFTASGVIHVGKFRKGRMVEHILDSRVPGESIDAEKPAYPGIDLRPRQEDFLKELELIWEERNHAIVRKAGLVVPKFQGGDVDDFALWVNSQVEYPMDRPDRDQKTVIVEFVVLRDGSVSDVHAIFGSDPVLNEAAVRAVAKSPKWTPGEQNGEKRSVKMNVPVVFNF